MYPEWLLGIRRNSTLLRQLDAENLTLGDLVKESQTPYTSQPAVPDAVRAKGQPGSGVVPVAGGESGDLIQEILRVNAMVDGGDRKVSELVRFPDASH